MEKEPKQENILEQILTRIPGKEEADRISSITANSNSIAIDASYSNFWIQGTEQRQLKSVIAEHLRQDSTLLDLGGNENNLLKTLKRQGIQINQYINVDKFSFDDSNPELIRKIRTLNGKEFTVREEISTESSVVNVKTDMLDCLQYVADESIGNIAMNSINIFVGSLPSLPYC